MTNNNFHVIICLLLHPCFHVLFISQSLVSLCYARSRHQIQDQTGSSMPIQIQTHDKHNRYKIRMVIEVCFGRQICMMKSAQNTKQCTTTQYLFTRFKVTGPVHINRHFWKCASFANQANFQPQPLGRCNGSYKRHIKHVKTGTATLHI